MSEEVPWNVPVLWNGDIYKIDSTDPHTESEEGPLCKLLKYSISNDSWSNYVIPCSIGGHRDDEQVHTLTTYHSKLLLINSADNKVWEFDSTFKQSTDVILPHSWKAEIVAATSEGDYLLVIRRARRKSWTSVVIFDSNVWMICDGPQFQKLSRIQVIIHNHSVFVGEWLADSDGIISLYQASLQSLLDEKYNAWHVLWSTLPVLSQSSSNLTILSNHLCMISHDSRSSYTHLWCYLMEYERWLELGNTKDIPRGIKLSRVVGLPDHSMIITLQGTFKDQLFHCKLKPGEAYGCNQWRIQEFM